MAFEGLQNELSPATTDNTGPHQLRMAHLDENFAPKAVVGEIFAKAEEKALLPRLGADRIEVVYGETVIPVTVTEPQAGQVGVGTGNEDREGYRKPLSGVAWSSKSFSPIKLAVIVTASEEFVRANPQNRFNSIKGKLSDAIARAMDLSVFHGRDALTGAALAGIDTSNVLASTTNVVPNYLPNGSGTGATNVLNDLMAAYDTIGEDYDPSTFVVDPRWRTKIAASQRGTDSDGNLMEPGSVDLNARQSSILGLNAFYHKAAPGRIGNYTGPTPPVRAFLGDFNQLKWGLADEIRFKVSDQATLTDGDGNTVSLWQTNQVAVLCEVTFGWVVGDLDAFAKVTEQVAA
jgi:HK97 family phage major capsid protein